jgi:putative ABC transport system permease protein
MTSVYAFADSLRRAVRTLRKQRVFATVVIVSLALAIGLNTTMYSVLDALIHPHVDMRAPENLYTVQYFGDYHFRVDDAQRDVALRSGLHSYEAITRVGASPSGGLLQHGSAMHDGGVAGVAANYFDVLGVRPMLGRTFAPPDEAEATHAVVLSQRVVPELFPRGGAVLGQTVTIGHDPYTVIGVVSEASDFPRSATAAWVVAPFDRTASYVRIIRLRSGATRQAMKNELAVVSGRIARAAGESPKDDGFRDDPLFSINVQFHYQGFHIAIIGSVIAVLLVACANLANIQLARGIGRRRELALRAALGADRGRLVRHVLLESTVLATAGLALGLLATLWLTKGVRATMPPIVGEFVADPRLDWRVLLFAVTATSACVLLVGVLPAIQISRVDPNELLKSGAGTGAHRRHRFQYGVLVAAEIALTLAIMSGAGVMVRSALAFSDHAYDAGYIGYDPRPLVSAQVFRNMGTATAVRIGDLLRTEALRARAVAGVADAAASTHAQTAHHAVTISDPTGVRQFLTPLFGYQVVSPSYFRVLRRPIVAGRDFAEGEQDHGAIILDEVMARRLWGRANPVGQYLKLGSMASSAAWVPVVGVAGMDAGGASRGALHPDNATSSDGQIFYLPGPADTIRTNVYRDPARALNAVRVAGVNVVARAAADPAHLAVAVHRALADDPAVFASTAAPMVEQLGLSAQVASHAFIAELFVAFAAIGVGLAAFGVYGVVAHSVAERRRELGVRIALGAAARDILHAVLRESTVVALAGVAAGLLLTKYAIVLLRWQAVEDDIYNAPLFLAVAIVLGAAVTISALLPALRATRIDPTESLRNE